MRDYLYEVCFYLKYISRGTCFHGANVLNQSGKSNLIALHSCVQVLRHILKLIHAVGDARRKNYMFKLFCEIGQI